MQIHIDRGGQRFGPYSQNEVKQYLALGNLLPTDLVWHEGAAGWEPLSGLVSAEGGATSRCHNCQTPVEPGQVICVGCGARLSGPTATRGARPVSATEEERQKNKLILIVGILLCVGWLLPLYLGEWSMPAFDFKGKDGVQVINLLMPIIVGATLCSIAYTTRPIARSIVLIVLGSLSVIFYLMMTDDRGAGIGRGLGALSDLMRMHFVLVLFVLGWSCLLTGTGTRLYRPDSKLAFILATVGGGLLCLFWLVPGKTGMPVVNVFKFFKHSIMLGLSSMAFMGMILAGSILCFVNLPSRSPGKAGKFARLSIWLVVGSFVVFTLLYLINPLVADGAGMGGNMEVKFSERLKIFGIGALLLIKLGLTNGVLMLALPLGCMDLFVGRADR